MYEKGTVVPLIFLFILFISFSFIVVLQTAVIPIQESEKEAEHNIENYFTLEELFNNIGEKQNYTTDRVHYKNNIDYNILTNNFDPETQIIYSDVRNVEFEVNTDISACEDEEEDSDICEDIFIQQESVYNSFINNYNEFEEVTIFGLDYPHYYSSNLDNFEGEEGVSAKRIKEIFNTDEDSIQIEIYTLENRNPEGFTGDRFLSLSSPELEEEEENITSRGYNDVSIRIPTLAQEKDWQFLNDVEGVNDFEYRQGSQELIRDSSVSGNEVEIEIEDGFEVEVYFYSFELDVD